ncbi:hypothetical protein GCM10010275_35400 [Streptomyces litmocidini]|nr:hypothetical protein GCM10010275_35400 [Streptomyces litmocidini]
MPGRYRAPVSRSASSRSPRLPGEVFGTVPPCGRVGAVDLPSVVLGAVGSGSGGSPHGAPGRP